MKSRVILLLSAAAVTIAAAPDPKVEARRGFLTYTQCVVAKHAREAAEVVLSDSTSGEIFEQHPDVVNGDCLYADHMPDSDMMRLPSADYLRYGLAEALVHREYASGLPPDIALAAPLVHRELKESDYVPKPGKALKPNELADLQKKRAADMARRALSIYGECVARTDPSTAFRLLFTEPGSNEEGQAFAALSPALSTCLPQGQTVELGKASLRGTVAMNLYRLAKAPRVARPATAPK